MDKGLNVFFLSGEGRGGGGTQGDRRKKEGIVLPEFIVAGCQENSEEGWFRERETKGRSLKRRGRRAAIRFEICSVSHRLLYRSFVGFSPDEQLQNFLGPQADACFGATPVPNVGKSSALLMSGAWKENTRSDGPLLHRHPSNNRIMSLN